MGNKTATVCFLLGMFFAALGIFFSSTTFVVAALVLTIFGWAGVKEVTFFIFFAALIFKSSEMIQEIISNPNVNILSLNTGIAILALIVAFSLPLLAVRVLETETLK